MNLSDLIAKIAALPENRLAEIERYVDTIARTEKPVEKQAEKRDLPEIVEHMNGGESYRSKKNRQYGFFGAPVFMSDDFEEPLECLKEYME